MPKPEVYRKIFRACFQDAVQDPKREDHMKDFRFISQQTLSPVEHELFTHHYLLGADYKSCCRKLKITKPVFYRARRRVEETLGAVLHAHGAAI